MFHIGFLELKWLDLLDIVLVGLLIYSIYKLMKGSVAIRVFVGFLSLYLFYLVVAASEMELLSSILGQFMGVGVIAAIILFQQELKKFLLLIGKTADMNGGGLLGFFKSQGRLHGQLDIEELMQAVKSLAAVNSGALIVLAGTEELKFYCESGDQIEARLSKRLLIAIFNKYSPLHDGAVIISKGRIKAARCILPVTDNQNLPPEFGLRHRAAVGMSEATGAAVIVVSEETGKTSFVKHGNVEYGLSEQALKESILSYMMEKKPLAAVLAANQDPL